MYRHFLAPLSLGLSALLVFLLVESTWEDSYPITNIKLFIESALGINHPLARKANPLPLQLPASTEATSQYTVTTLPTMHFVGIEKKVEVNNKLFTQELTNAWQAYARNAKTIGIKNKVNNNIYIIYSDYSPLPKGYISVFLAYRVSEYADIPAGFDILTVPRHSYAIFNVNQRRSPQIAACWDKINRFNLNRTYRYDMESYPSSSSTSDTNTAQIMISIH